MTVILKEVEYSEFAKTERRWILQPTRFQQINLIVGLNATGKTRFINLACGLGHILTGKRRVKEGTYKATFSSELGVSVYELSIVDGLVKRERLTVEKNIVLNRNADGKGKIQANKLDNKKIDFECPPDQLAAVYRRDSIQHPFLQHLHDWASNAKLYKFGTPMGADTLFIPKVSAAADEIKISDISPGQSNFDYNNTVAVYVAGYQAYKKKFDQQIIADMSSVGYRLSDVGARHLDQSEFQGATVPPILITATEKNLKRPIRQIDMSSGMFRALSLIIQLNLWAFRRDPVSLFIDDIGEGLDHSRSTRLIKLLVNKSIRSGFQLIMTTNDRFVMNSVPLKYWGIMERTGQRVRVMSALTHPERFKNAEAFGLSNFDVFSRKLYR